MCMCAFVGIKIGALFIRGEKERNALIRLPRCAFFPRAPDLRVCVPGKCEERNFLDHRVYMAFRPDCALGELIFRSRPSGFSGGFALLELEPDCCDVAGSRSGNGIFHVAAHARLCEESESLSV